MKKVIVTTLVLASVVLNAQVIPGINSKGGAMVLPQGKIKMGIKNINFTRDTMYDGTSEATNVQGLEAKANITLLALIYGVAKDLDVKIILPYKNFNATASLPNISAPVKFPVEIDNKGIGDIVVMARYKLLNSTEYGYDLAIGGGVKLPTGSTDETFKVGPPTNPDMSTPLPTQLGTGAAEYKAELGFSKEFGGDVRLDAHTMYTYRPLAKNDYDFGNELSYDVGVNYGVSKNINLGVEYNGKYNTQTDSGTDPEPVSPFPFKSFSGTVGYVTPQVQWLPFDKPKLHIGLGVSILANYNVKVYQPLEKQRYVVRLGYLF